MSFKVYLLFFTTILMAANYGMIIPVQPMFAEQMHLTTSQYGMIVGVFALFQLIFTPYFGQLADEKGRAKYIWMGLLIFALSDLLYFLAPSYEWLMVSRMIGGVGAAMTMPAINGMIVDLTDEKHRAKAMMYLGASFSLGIIAGPIIGGMLGGIWYKLPFLVVAIVGIINAIMTFFLVKDVKEFPNSKVKMLGTLKELMINVRKFFKGSYRVIFVSMLLFGMVLYGSETLISFYAEGAFHVTPQAISIMFVMIGVFEFGYQTILGERIINRFGEIKFLSGGIFITGIGLFLVPFVGSYEGMLLLIPMIAAGWIGMGACNSYLSKQESENVATLMSINQFFMSLGGTLGPIVIMSSFEISTLAPFALSLALCLAAGIIVLFASKK